MENADVYPLKYAQIAIGGKEGRILEAGCGAGRILRYYHDLGYDITGIDFMSLSFLSSKLLMFLKVMPGDITNLDFSDEYFHHVLAFGLYHNLEKGLGKALAETSKILVSGGVLCASFKPTTSKLCWSITLLKKMGITRYLQQRFSIRRILQRRNQPISLWCRLNSCLNLSCRQYADTLQVRDL